MSRSKHQRHPDWRNKKNRKTLKCKTYKLKPYGMCWLSGYNDYYKHRTELFYNETKKSNERKLNKIDILNIEDE